MARDISETAKALVEGDITDLASLEQAPDEHAFIHITYLTALHRAAQEKRHRIAWWEMSGWCEQLYLDHRGEMICARMSTWNT